MVWPHHDCGARVKSVGRVDADDKTRATREDAPAPARITRSLRATLESSRTTTAPGRDPWQHAIQRKPHHKLSRVRGRTGESRGEHTSPIKMLRPRPTQTFRPFQAAFAVTLVLFRLGRGNLPYWGSSGQRKANERGQPWGSCWSLRGVPSKVAEGTSRLSGAGLMDASPVHRGLRATWRCARYGSNRK